MDLLPYLVPLLFVALAFAAVFVAPVRWLLSAVLVGIGVYLLLDLRNTPPDKPSREVSHAWAELGDTIWRRIELVMGIVSIGLGLVLCAVLVALAVRRRKLRAQRDPRRDLPRAQAIAGRPDRRRLRRQR